MHTQADAAAFVRRTLGPEESKHHDVAAIARQLRDEYGTWDLSTVPLDEYWQMVEKHQI